MIGVFDSGYGGLTILEKMREVLPLHDFIYLGDNARTPYGSRSFETIYTYSLQAVNKLFGMGCSLVVFACNTASAKALRTIQQLDLPLMSDPSKRVLGVIRPSVEAVVEFTQTNHVALLGTEGTVQSHSFDLEIAKLHKQIQVFSLACPMWVPLVENGEYSSEGAHYFVKRDLQKLFSLSSQIDTLMLACTHYPLLLPVIKEYIPSQVRIFTQGDIVAKSLKDYLFRHPEMDARCSKESTVQYFTTEQAYKFNDMARQFLKMPINAIHCTID